MEKNLENEKITGKGERWKIEENVFDKITLHTLGRMISKNIFQKLEGLIAVGKESNVYKAKSEKGNVAVKIFKIETANFYRRNSYLIGDPRFQVSKRTDRDLVYIFCSKEFKNLIIAEEAKVNAPKPFMHEKNVIAFSFLGKKGESFPRLADVHSEYYNEDLYMKILKDLKKLYKKNLIHSDISEYNILYDFEKEKHYIIDFGQGVLTSHPKAMEFLERDIYNLTKFFKKNKGLKISLEEAIKFCKE